MAEKISPRIAWVDFAKGLVMILVVLGHATVYDIDLNKFIYVFHMPFFFIMAGFLLNLNKWGGVYKNFSLKLFKRLLVPYYLANFLWYPFLVAKEACFGHLLKIIFYISPVNQFLGIFAGHPIFLPLGPLWFLPCLFVAEIIFIRLYNRLAGISTEIFVLAIALSACAGFFLRPLGYLPFGLNVALIAQIFLLAGILIRRHNIVEGITSKLCGGLTLLLVLAFQFNERVEMSFTTFGEPLLFYSGAVAGSLLVMKFSALMTDGRIFSLISDCGRQSMMILVLHPLIIELLFNVLVRNNFATLAEIYEMPIFIVLSTATGVLIPLFIAKKFGKLPVLKYFCA